MNTTCVLFYLTALTQKVHLHRRFFRKKKRTIRLAIKQQLSGNEHNMCTVCLTAQTKKVHLYRNFLQKKANHTARYQTTTFRE